MSSLYSPMSIAWRLKEIVEGASELNVEDSVYDRIETTVHVA